MCHFITLVARTEDLDGLRSILREFGRDARPVANPSVEKALLDGERQFLTTRGACDCGTVLGAGPRDEVESNTEADASRLARKGWSKAKIARALEASQRAASRTGGRETDSIPLWAEIISALGSRLSLPHAGLLVHSYSGSIADEVFPVVRREIPKGRALTEGLEALREDEIVIFGTR